MGLCWFGSWDRTVAASASTCIRTDLHALQLSVTNLTWSLRGVLRCSHYHCVVQLFQTFANNPNGIFLGPFVGKNVPALPPGTLNPSPTYPIPTGLKK